MSRRDGQMVATLSMAVVIGLVVFLSLLDSTRVSADAAPQAGATRFLSFAVNRGLVPSWVVSRQMTYRVKVGVVSSVIVSGDGHQVPSRYDATTRKVIFTTDAVRVNLILYDSTSDPSTIGQIETTMLRDDKRWALSLTMDDGYISQYMVGRAYLEKYGYKGAIAINGRSLDDTSFSGKQYINDAQMRDLADNGWGIFNHTYSHYWVSQFPNTAAALADIKRNRDRIVAAGVTTPTIFVAPYVDAAYYDIIRLNGNQNTSVQVYQGSGSALRAMEDLSTVPTDLLSVGRDGVAQVDPLVDQVHQFAVSYPDRHFWLYLNTHEVDSGCDPVETTIDYLYQNYGKAGTDEVWVAPINTVYDYWTNRRKASVPISATVVADRPIIVDSAADPAAVLPGAGTQIALTARVTDPLSNISSVSVDLSAIGRAPAGLLDDGAHGDGAAGDGVYGVLFSIPPAISTGKKEFAITALDEAGRSATATVIVLVATTLPTPPPATPTPVPPVGPVTSVTLRQGLNGYTGTTDASIGAINPTTNFGGDGGLVVDNRGTSLWRTLMRFNLAPAAIPANTIVTKATLNVYILNQGNTRGNCLNVFRVKRAWTESQATWNRAQTGVPWAIAGVDGGSDRSFTLAGCRSYMAAVNVWRSVDVTDLVQAWVNDPASNYGMLLMATGVQGVQTTFAGSAWGTASLRPYLTIQWASSLGTATPTGTPTITQTPTVSGTPTQTGTITRTPTVTPTGANTNTPTVTNTPTQTAVVTQYAQRVNSGGTLYNGGDVIWDADRPYTAGSWGYVGGSTYSTSATIGGTTDVPLYQRERWWSGSGSYRFDVPNGTYQVTLKFAEIYSGAAGQRVFSVRLEGNPVLSGFDIFAAAGGKNRAVDRTFTVIVSDGQLNIDLVPSVGAPKVNGIAVESGIAVAPTATATRTPTSIAQSPTASSTATATVPGQPAATATATGTATTAPPYQKAVNAGGAVYTDSVGLVWRADQAYAAGGWGYVNFPPPEMVSAAYSYNHAIAGTADGGMYQSERFSVGGYRFTVPNGAYAVTLKFAEIYPYTQIGERVFDVQIEGSTVLTSLDVLAAAGGLWRALDYSYTVNVSDGVVTIDFVRHVGYPKINAIVVTSVSP